MVTEQFESNTESREKNEVLQHPEFGSEREKQAFLNEILPIQGNASTRLKQNPEDIVENIDAPKRKIPPMNGGMGIDLSNENLVMAMMDKRKIGTLAASFVSYPELMETEFLKGMPFEERQKACHEANKRVLLQKIDTVREKNPYGILAVNLMRAASDYDKSAVSGYHYNQDVDKEKVTGMFETIGDSKKVDLLLVGAGLDSTIGHKMESFPHMRYGVIVSNLKGARVAINVANKIDPNTGKKGRIPDVLYVEMGKNCDGEVAGGHLGDSQGKTPEQTISEIKEYLKSIGLNIPIILAGGIAYPKDVEKAYEIANGVSIGTRLLLTQESGLPNNIIEQYLTPNREVVIDKTSPAGMDSQHIENSEMWARIRLPQIVKETKLKCVKCLLADCQHFNSKEEENPTSFDPALLEKKREAIGSELCDLIANLTLSETGSEKEVHKFPATVAQILSNIKQEKNEKNLSLLIAQLFETRNWQQESENVSELAAELLSKKELKEQEAELCNLTAQLTLSEETSAREAVNFPSLIAHLISEIKAENNPAKLSLFIGHLLSTIKKERSYCILEFLSATRLGKEWGLHFTGSVIKKTRNDALYKKNEKPYIPTIAEAIEFSTSGKLPAHFEQPKQA